MQAGTTAINSFGIANPLKQSRDREGALVRRWLRELASVPPADSFSEGP
jgi:deoxyribodipyrimidine photolyase